MEKGRREAGVPNGTAGCYASPPAMARFFLLRHRYTRGGQEIFQIGTIFAEKVFQNVKSPLPIIVKVAFWHYKYKNVAAEAPASGRPPRPPLPIKRDDLRDIFALSLQKMSSHGGSFESVHS